MQYKAEKGLMYIWFGIPNYKVRKCDTHQKLNLIEHFNIGS